MPFASGQRLTAARLNRVQPATYIGVQSAQLTLSATMTDVPGCSITLATLTDGAVYVAQAVFDFDLTAATTSTQTGRLLVDGAAQTQVARFGAEVSTDTATVAQQWRGTLATAGTHTLKIQGSGTSAVLFAHSTLLVTIYEVVS